MQENISGSIIEVITSIATAMLIPLLLVAASNAILWFLSKMTYNYTFLDAAWPIGFFVLISHRLISSVVISNGNFAVLLANPADLVVLLWAARLILYLFIRNWNRQYDARFVFWQRPREGVISSQHISFLLWRPLASVIILVPVFILGLFWQAVRFVATVFASAASSEMPQQLLGGIVAAFSMGSWPWLYIMQPATAALIVSILQGVALIGWIIGFAFEVIADFQLFTFIKNPANHNRVLQAGLWRYSRHPNYFGELLMWWSLWFAAFVSAPIPALVFGIWSPLLMTYLVTRVWGIPFVENQFRNTPEYQEYKRHTSCLIPCSSK